MFLLQRSTNVNANFSAPSFCYFWITSPTSYGVGRMRRQGMSSYVCIHFLVYEFQREFQREESRA